MLFHTCHTFIEDVDVVRKDWDCATETTHEASLHYEERLKEGWDLAGSFGLTYVYGSLLERSFKMGAFTAQVQMPGMLGAACLYLLNDVGYGQKYALHFQKRCARFAERWSLPLTPLEVDSRPLFYYVFFDLEGDRSVWKQVAPDMMEVLNGIGLGLLRVVKPQLFTGA